jgi:hypothetical protein
VIAPWAEAAVASDLFEPETYFREGSFRGLGVAGDGGEVNVWCSVRKQEAPFRLLEAGDNSTILQGGVAGCCFSDVAVSNDNGELRLQAWPELVEVKLENRHFPIGVDAGKTEIPNVIEETPKWNLLRNRNCKSLQRFGEGLTFLYNSSSCIMRHIYAAPCESRFQRSSA